MTCYVSVGSWLCGDGERRCHLWADTPDEAQVMAFAVGFYGDETVRSGMESPTRPGWFYPAWRSFEVTVAQGLAAADLGARYADAKIAVLTRA